MKALEVTIDTITAELGERMAHWLAEHFGGQRIQIPDCCDKTSTLTRSLGIKAARVLSQRFGGSVISLPTANEHRRREIARLRRQRMNPLAIARQLGVTQRYVCDVLAEQRYRSSHASDG